MEDDSNTISPQGGRRSTRLRRAGSLAGALIGLAVLAAACSSGSASPGVANVSATSTSAASSSNSSSGTNKAAGALAFSQCMRAHGVTDFPDPGSGGRISIQGGPGSDLDPNNPTMKAAQQACEALQPKPSAAQQHQMEQAALKYAQCMRAHGIKDFPDPGSGGRISIQGGPGSDLDPNSPTFQAAQNSCQHLLPGANGGGKLTTRGGGSGGPGLSISGSAGK
jgi:hypothetical protein